MMLRRNQVIITALVVMIGVAGYLNFQDSRQAEQASHITLSEHGEISALVPNGTDNDLFSEVFEIGEALTMDDNGNIIQVDTIGRTNLIAEGVSDATEPVFVNTTLSSSFFVQAKLEREQSRSRQKEILMTLINDSNIEADQRAASADAMLEIQSRIEKETAAEAMIEARGFREVYVRMGDDYVDVVVDKDTLTEAEIAQIEDIIRRKTGVNTDQIRISPMRRQ